MANIMINQVCNVKCPYCFANEFVNSENYIKNKDSLNISLENFQKALDFVITEPNERIGIIGGEPTIHPQFKEIMENLIFDDRVNNVLLFTNGITLDKHVNLLANNKFNILINCNSPNDIGEAQYKKIVENLDILINSFYMKERITLGINMYKVGFDYDYILALLDRYQFNHVRTSISVPNSLDKKSADPLEYFVSMKESVFKFFKELEKRKIAPNYDCNLMPCCIPTYEEADWLKTFLQFEGNKNNFCNIGSHSICSPVIDILPNLNAVRCFGLSDQHKVSINKFKNLRELKNYFFNYYDSFSHNICSSPTCEMCQARLNMQCSGGCLSFKVDKINKAREYCNSL